MPAPLVIYCVLVALTLFAPLRWAVIAYVLLSAVDFNTGNAGVGVFNAIKGVGVPLWLLWRFRQYAGHGRIISAPILWMLLTGYAAIASISSLFGLSALKLVGEMAGSFLICMVFLRATKARALTPRLALPLTAGLIGIAMFRTLLIHFTGATFQNMGGDTPDRFTAFVTAQGFASLLTALFCIAVTSRSIRGWIRTVLCISIFAALLLDGSRLWLIAFVLAGILALLIADTPAWTRIVAMGAICLAIIGAIAVSGPLLSWLESQHDYRIAAAITAAYAGNQKDSGLGTIILRRQLDARAIRMIEEGSVTQIAFGHGTSNGRLIMGSIDQGIGDPNRAVHNEWLRVLYEWGIAGSILWLLFLGSLMLYAIGALRFSGGFGKPLFVFLPAFCVGLSGENIIAGAGHAENIGLLICIGLASIAYREARPAERIGELDDVALLFARGSFAAKR